MVLILFVLALFISISSASAASVTPAQVANASGSVKSYVDVNHTLPGSVNISGNNVNMPTYLGLETSAILNISKNSNTAVAIKSFGAAPAPLETVTTRTISKSDYLSMASRVKSYMVTNGRAPNYATQTSTGSKIRYESLVYMFSQILDYYNKNKVLPNSITVNPWKTVTKPVNSTDYGYVEKKYYGNQKSNQTIVIIIGVHPQEKGIHTAIYNAITSKSSKLTKRYVLYYIHVTKDVNDYTKSRTHGQDLAAQFVVPDVPKEHPVLVLDNHENHGADSGYTHYRFFYPISNTSITTDYANKIISKMKTNSSVSPDLVIYYPPNPTSPEHVTGPIAANGITTLIYETYAYDSTGQKIIDANAFIDALDSLNKSTDFKSPTVTVDHKGNIFNTPQTVTLTTTDPDSATTKTYYTTDGSDPQTSSIRTEYTAPIVLSGNTTLKFSAVDPANHWSPVYIENYVINSTIPIVTADPNGSAFKTPQTVTLTTTCPDSTATTYYTTDGSDPRTSDTKKQYIEPIMIDATTTLLSAAINGLGNWGPVFNQTYIIDTTAPTVNATPAGGDYYTPQNVVLAANETSDIYYTLDGTDPTKDSAKYKEAINIGTSKTLKFTAWDSAGNQSQIYTAKYSIYKNVTYSYTVKVAYKKGWYKYWYKVSYKKWYKSYYKYKGKWKYKWKYTWATKSKYTWKYGWIYKNVTKYGTKYVLT